ncbi:MAG: hypothetical protein ACRC4L_04220, partial [Mycoplasma sp.]
MPTIFNQKEMKYKIGWKKFFIKFCFPLFPVKITSSIYLMVFLGALFGLRLVLGLFGVPVVGLGFKISFAWLPIYICGFFYGPIVGLIFGAVMDTVSFFVFG